MYPFCLTAVPLNYMVSYIHNVRLFEDTDTASRCVCVCRGGWQGGWGGGGGG